jgi:hypothetical protein
VIIGVLFITAVASLMKTRRDERKNAASAESVAADIEQGELTDNDRSPLESGDNAADRTGR